MSMSHRERALRALNHEEPDRIPIDLGGSDTTGIMVGPYRRLCEHFEIDVKPIYVMDIMQQCVILNEKLTSELDVDIKGIYQLPKSWYEGQAYDGTKVLYPEGFRPELRSDGSQIVRDAVGNIDMLMPKDGYFFDPVLHPLEHISTIAEIGKADHLIENYDRPSWLDLQWEHLAQQAKEIRETTDKLIVGMFSGHIFQAAQIIRGWTQFMIDLISNPALAEALMDRLAEAHIRAFDRYAKTIGQYVDIIQICDDLGMQDALFMKPEMYRKHVKPYQGKLYKYIKENCNALLMMHSDGSLYPIIPDLIEIGVDILNPIQFTAKNMELSRLKREFGNDLCFWGGGVNTQSTLPFENTERVADEVRRNIDILAPGGGFVFATVHNITEGVPVENILTTYRTAAEHGRY